MEAQLNSIADLKILERPDGLVVWRIGRNRLREFTRTVYHVYDTVYDSAGIDTLSDGDLHAMYAEDLRLLPVSIFLAIACPSGEIVATVRISKITRKDKFPIETVFKINPHEFAKQLRPKPHIIWHGGRLCVDKETLLRRGFPRSYSVRLVKDINRYVFKLMPAFADDVIFAEIDQMAERIFHSMGFHWKIIGETLFYLGSMTSPVMIRYGDINKVAWIGDSFEKLVQIAKAHP